jgi:anti-sigma factor RsiW
MNCRELIEVLADYLEQSLPADVVEALERHLADCGPCRAYLATYRRTRTIGAEAQRLEMPDEMRSRLRRFLVEHLREKA